MEESFMERMVIAPSTSREETVNGTVFSFNALHLDVDPDESVLSIATGRSKEVQSERESHLKRRLKSCFQSIEVADSKRCSALLFRTLTDFGRLLLSYTYCLITLTAFQACQIDQSFTPLQASRRTFSDLDRQKTQKFWEAEERDIFETSGEEEYGI
jgi:hypothetical protein